MSCELADSNAQLAGGALWYKDAIVYQTHVRAYRDSNGDGVGDFKGLTSRLEYIASLGVNAIWLLPFYPSPLSDDGYDIAEYCSVHELYGNLDDVRSFIAETHRLGLRVIFELVINHTSYQHPWFQAARKAPRDSAERDFYVWSDDNRRFPETRIIFSDTESSNWAWDEVAQQYYWHRFFSHQPDLNLNNPRVVEAIIRVMRFWLDMGVDGLRLDAIPYLCVRDGTNNESLPETHAVIRQMRAVVDAHYQDRMFLAEANQWPEDVREYFGAGDECHMAYHFPLMPRMFMALAQEDRHPVVEIMEQTPDIPENCQWAVFLRNHDELTLEMVSDKERDYMYRTYAAEPQMRVNVGIRRRLAAILGNDRDKICLLNSLLLSMPGSPVLYYGDEIGMGDNIYLGDRNAVRTPMQWTSDRNGGFSTADPQRLYLPAVMDPVFGYQAVNVEAQERDLASLLNWTRRIIAVRKAHPCFGRGEIRFLHPANRKILAYLRTHGDDVVLCVANLSRHAQAVGLDLFEYAGRVPVELLGRSAFPPLTTQLYMLSLAGHGFFWLQLTTDVPPPSWHSASRDLRRLRVLVAPEAELSFVPERSARRDDSRRLLHSLQDGVLADYLCARSGTLVNHVSVADQGLWEAQQATWILLVAHVEFGTDQIRSCLLALAIDWQSDLVEGTALQPNAVARIRRQAQIGLVLDALGHDDFVRALWTGFIRRAVIPMSDGSLIFEVLPDLGPSAGQAAAVASIRCEPGEAGSVILDERFRLRTCPPVIEDWRQADAWPAPLAGAMVHRHASGREQAVAVLELWASHDAD